MIRPGALYYGVERRVHLVVSCCTYVPFTEAEDFWYEAYMFTAGSGVWRAVWPRGADLGIKVVCG